MDSRLKSVEVPSSSTTQLSYGHCFECGDPTHFRNRCPQLGRDRRKQKPKLGKQHGYNQVRENQLSYRPLGNQQPQLQPQHQQSQVGYILSHTSSETDHRTEDEIIAKIVGLSSEAEIYVEDVPCQCLLDNGSQVTTISHSFYMEHLSDLPLESLNNLLDIKGGAEQSIPYLGYIDVSIRMPEDSSGLARP